MIGIILACCLCACEDDAPTPSNRPKPKPSEPDIAPSEIHEYKIYFGNTHSHCFYSGDAIQTDDNSPMNHFAIASREGYDFYAVTDHSQYERFTTSAWRELEEAALRATSPSFVALRGFEYSENNGPGAKGHLNTFNSPSYLNALEDGIDMPYFHDWLSAEQNRDAVVSMNHPSTHQYEDFACYNSSVKQIITLFEVINGNNNHYDAFCNALSKGWKVSPIAGCDNHGVSKISSWQPRTGIAADELSRSDILEAMRNRRTYATYDNNLRAIYYVDNYVMGSEFAPKSKNLHFRISVEEPDNDYSSVITKIEIIGADTKVIQAETFSNRKVLWESDVAIGKNAYFYVIVYNSSSGNSPVAYLAPVWIK